jgi:predicted dehydrogenase
MESRAKAKGEAFGVPYFTDLGQMLAKVEFDLLVNLTSVPNHFAVSLKGLQAGRHVYTQKPMTITVEEANRLIDEAARRKLKLVAEEAKPLLVANRTIRKLLDDGVLGKVVWARATCSHWGPAIIDNWPTDPEWFYQKGVGPLRDVGVERLHRLTHLLGPAKRVAAMSGINQPEVVVRGGPCAGRRIVVGEDDITLLTLDFGDSVFATLDAAWVNHRATRVPPLEIYGEKGVITLIGEDRDRADPRGVEIELYRDEPDHSIRGWTKVDVIPPLKNDPAPAVAGLHHAIECILNDTKPVISGEIARHCIEIMEKAYVAARTGITQSLETAF